jgi:flavorubredoxin
MVAENISGVLKKNGLEVDSVFVSNADKSAVKNYDCLIVGGPTMSFRVTPKIRQFLDSLSSTESSGRMAAAFDTQIKGRFTANATKGIEGKLKSLGFKLITAPLVAYVEGKLRQNTWQLKEGELAKTKEWAQEVSNTLKK